MALVDGACRYLELASSPVLAAPISGDRHLLALSEPIPVYSPRAFLDELS